MFPPGESLHRRSDVNLIQNGDVPTSWFDVTSLITYNGLFGRTQGFVVVRNAHVFPYKV